MKKTHKLSSLVLGLLLLPLLEVGFSSERAIAHILGDRQEVASETDPTATDSENPDGETAADPELAARLETLAEADLLYLQGDRAEAEKLYRQVKEPFPEQESSKALEPVYDLEQFDSPAGRVFWREAQAGWNGDPKLESRIFVPLNMLVENHPEFVPAHVLLAEAHQHYDRPEEALQALERAASVFPDSLEVVKAHVTALEESKQYLEASVAARQFALVNSDHPEAPAMMEIADKNLGDFQKYVKQQMVGKGILGTAIGAGSCAIFGGCSTARAVGQAVGLGALMLQGESGLGKQLSDSYKQQLELVEDEEVLEYVNKIGFALAELMGRDFEYEFNVVRDDTINAFVLPGGKVFINTGAILNTNSEAELAGLLAHEIAHAVLSHGFEQFASSQLNNSLGQVIDGALGNKLPIGSIISTLVNLKYSRTHERQADVVGTRVLATAGYAADGLRNLMVTLAENQGNSSPPGFLSTHPASKDRVGYIEELIESNGYNRFSFEGVEKHAAIQERLK
ncbi:MAG: M48 family metalloprotease [Oscillatoria sp. SIO1A7]|nr:M48 family metalloprotease [Oscillatoria sp. SIO1A7]